jgi:hypothetical protein
MTGPGRRIPAPAAPPRWWRDVAASAAVLSVVVVVALWLANGGVRNLQGLGEPATSAGRLTGLVASDLLLIQVLLMARIPWPVIRLGCVTVPEEARTPAAASADGAEQVDSQADEQGGDDAPPRGPPSVRRLCSRLCRRLRRRLPWSPWFFPSSVSSSMAGRAGAHRLPRLVSADARLGDGGSGGAMATSMSLGRCDASLRHPVGVRESIALPECCGQGRWSRIRAQPCARRATSSSSARTPVVAGSFGPVRR